MDRVQYESRMETQGCTLGGPSGAAATCAAPHQLQGLTTSRSSVRQSPSLWLKLVILHPLAFPQFWRSSAVSIHLLICSISGKSCATALQVLSYLRLLLSYQAIALFVFLTCNCTLTFTYVPLHSQICLFCRWANAFFSLCHCTFQHISLREYVITTALSNEWNFRPRGTQSLFLSRWLSNNCRWRGAPFNRS